MSEVPAPFNVSRYIVIHTAMPKVSDSPWAEETLHEFHEVVEWVAEMQIDPDHLHSIIEIDLVNGKCSDASKRVASAVAYQFRRYDCFPHPLLAEWLEDHGQTVPTEADNDY